MLTSSTRYVKNTSRSKRRYRDHLKTVLVAPLDKVGGRNSLFPVMGYSKPFMSKGLLRSKNWRCQTSWERMRTLDFLNGEFLTLKQEMTTRANGYFEL